MRFLANLTRPRNSEIFGHTSLRGIAAFCVIGYHATLSAGMPNQPGATLQDFFLNSFLFVDLFFMLSGFIMVESYGQKIFAKPKYRGVFQFWYKRAVKILPNYYFWLAVSIAFFALSDIYFDKNIIVGSCFPRAIASHLLLTQNIQGSCLYFNPPLWSIIVEIIAYLFFPLILLTVPLWPVLCGVAMGSYFFLINEYHTLDLIDGVQSVLRCFAGFILGAACTRIVNILDDFWLTWLQLPAFLGVGISLAYGHELFALAFIFSTVLLTARNIGPLVFVLRNPFIYLFGRASFSIYLAHVPVLGVITLIAYKAETDFDIPFASHWPFFLVLNILVSAIIGTYSYILIERRFEKWFRSSATP